MMNATVSVETGSDLDARLSMVVDVVSAFVGNNRVAQDELLQLIAAVSKTFADIANKNEEVEPVVLEPKISIRKSVTPDYIFCLEDGLGFRSLKRHLRTKYGLSPEQYRTKWGLPADYPMVAPSYSAARSQLAKSAGLGQMRNAATLKKASAKAVVKGPAKVAASKKPPRSKKS